MKKSICLSIIVLFIICIVYFMNQHKFCFSKDENNISSQIVNLNKSLTHIHKFLTEKYGAEYAFDSIYAKNVWGGSGTGSIPSNNKEYLILQDFLDTHSDKL